MRLLKTHSQVWEGGEGVDARARAVFSLLDGFKDEYHHGPNKFRDVSGPNKFRDVSGLNNLDVSGPNKFKTFQVRISLRRFRSE